ncbi:MAG: SDR family oxidoreductase [Bacteroidetes bacterium]|nr:SDR family oxidoreductase [Bacteroidota bacterium]
MNINFNFATKKYVVTGATSGIGKKITEDLINNGAEVLAIGRRADKLENLKEKFGAKIRIEPLDVNNFDLLKVAIEKFSEEKRIDGSVHCAGINKFTPLRAFNWNDAEQIIKTSLFAGIELIKIVSSKKISSGKGSHILIGSVAGIKGEVGFTAYSAAKSAVIGAVRTMALELAIKDIRVNTITPGWIQTEMTDSIDARYPGHIETIKLQHPLGIGTVEDVSNLAMFLLSDEAKWITGTNIVIDGGYSIK